MILIIYLILYQKSQSIYHIRITSISHLFTQTDQCCRRNVIPCCKLPYAVLYILSAASKSD